MIAIMWQFEVKGREAEFEEICGVEETGRPSSPAVLSRQFTA
jgi:hypothetical protein